MEQTSSSIAIEKIIDDSRIKKIANLKQYIENIEIFSCFI